MSRLAGIHYKFRIIGRITACRPIILQLGDYILYSLCETLIVDIYMTTGFAAPGEDSNFNQSSEFCHQIYFR